MTELRHEIATLLSEELPWPEASALAGRVLTLVSKPEVYPEHAFALRCKAIWPEMRQGEITTLRLLISKDFVRNSEILYATETEAETDIIKVWISRLRRCTGVKIKNYYRTGYSILETDRKYLKETIGDLT
jgi:hypothetical protein